MGLTAFPTVRVAAVQATPVILDVDRSVAKAVELIASAADAGAQLVVLPETFVSAVSLECLGAGGVGFAGFDELWERLWASSLDVPGPYLERLIAACREHDVVCAIGVNERECARPGTIYNTLLLLGPRDCCNATAS